MQKESTPRADFEFSSGTELEVLITDLSRSGSGVGKDGSGRVIFVPFTLAGDRVRVRLISASKRYAEGRVLEFLEYSADRQQAPCPVFQECGGCQWQHVPYAIQWETKKKGAQHALVRVGVHPEEQTWCERPAEQIWEYRNRIQLRGDQSQIGYFAPKSHQLVSIDRCWIARPELNALIPGVRETGIQRLRSGKSRDSYKVEIEVLEDGQTRQVWDSRHGTAGFRQIHDEQNAKLRALVGNWIEGEDVLLDLFGGAGNLSLPMATRFKRVDCVDFGSPVKSPPQGTPSHFHFHKGGVLPWLQKERLRLKAEGARYSAILDPPRTGLGAGSTEDAQRLVKILSELPVFEIVAVGCDVETWAHDLSKLSKSGWRVQKAGALDLFPQTPHVEAIARLVRDSR